MKKILFILSTSVLLSASVMAQTPETPKQQNFDKKFRFGLRATPQLVWLTSKSDVAKGAGVGTGFGFGLILDFKLSDIVHFSTGIGGDFDGGKITYKYVDDPSNPANDFSVNLALDKENNMIKAKDGSNLSDYAGVNGNQFFSLDKRKYKATYVSIPLLLKMFTQEYGGLRHVFVFGGEMGIRAGLKANDTYHDGYKTVVSGTATTSEKITELSVTGLNVGKDGSVVPIRFGMNLGYGVEYRLGGSTSVYTSLNYFHSFTNLVRSESAYLSKGNDNTIDPATSTINFSNLNQAHFAKAVRLSIGLMF
jgi:hypothetical protein